MATVEGRIIRIVDQTTVVINVGKKHGVKVGDIFRIEGSREVIIDPETGAELGKLLVTKGSLKVTASYDQFSLAVSKWVASLGEMISMSFTSPQPVREIGSELSVNRQDIKPWGSSYGGQVVVGDKVVRTYQSPRPE